MQQADKWGSFLSLNVMLTNKQSEDNYNVCFISVLHIAYQLLDQLRKLNFNMQGPFMAPWRNA